MSKTAEVKDRLKNAAAKCVEEAFTQLLAKDTEGPATEFAICDEYNVTILLWRLTDAQREVHTRVAARKE